MGSEASRLRTDGAQISEAFDKFTGYTPSQVAKLKERFELITDEFGLTKEQLGKLLKLNAKESQHLDAVFGHFDLDGNGRVDAYEFICGMTMLSSGTLDQKAELIFRLYDFDSSGNISRDEMVIMMRSTLSSLNSMAKQAAPSTKQIEEATDQFFLHADINKDNSISLKEFKSYVSKNKEILNLLDVYHFITSDDLRTDFGGGDDKFPDADSDLENEVENKDFKRNDKQERAKDGIEGGVGLFEEEDMGEGDQFMAVKPYEGVVQNSVPTNYKPSKGESDPPEAILELEYVHGYRCHDTRNNIFYNVKGQLVYHSAGVGIALNPSNNTQQHFFGHNDDVTAIAMHPDGEHFVTGQVGKKPLLCVWSSVTMECKATFSGVLTKGITHVAISNDGTRIAAIAADNDHTLAVYEWSPNAKKINEKPVVTGKGPRAKLLSLQFEPDDTNLLATCVKEIDFISVAGKVKCSKGIWGKKVEAQAALCAAYIDGKQLITGLFDGSIAKWKGKNLSGTIQAHKKSVTAMAARSNGKGLITGGGDGMVIMWDTSLTNVQQLDLSQKNLKVFDPKIRSVFEELKGGKIAVGTRSGDIVEFQGDAGQVVMRGHHMDELWGLAVHPSKSEYVTFGEDSLLAIWDVASRKQLRATKAEYPGKAVAISPNGSLIAVGYNNGQVGIYDATTLAQKSVRKDRKKEISELRFSPNSQYLTVGAHDSQIFVYDVKNNFKMISKMKSHHSTVTHMDFTEDSDTLQSNCTSYEILYHSIRDGKQVTSGASRFKDEKWATWTCVLGWPVQGIFPPGTDGTDMNSCDRSPSGDLLAVADDFGKVKLFKYPCAQKIAGSNDYRGHSSHVTNVRFLSNNKHVISTGGGDKSVFQWKLVYDREAEQESMSANKIDAKSIEMEADNEINKFSMFEEEEMGDGDQFMAVKPYKGEVDNSWPTNFKADKTSNKQPNGNLTLKHVLGYRCFDTRNNVRYTADNQVLYTAAAVGIVVEPERRTQTFFTHHGEDVVSLALHPKKKIVATGQMAQRGKAKMIEIYVWKSDTKEVLACLKGFHRRAVRQLDFSPDGKFLLSVGQDEDNSCAIYDWKSKRVVATAKVNKEKVMDSRWSTNTTFVTAGLKHIKFWTLNGTNLKSQGGLMGSGRSFEPQMCITFAFDTKTCITGTSQGNVVTWNGRNAKKFYPAHRGQVWALLARENNTLLTGGQDSKIVIWDSNMAKLNELDLSSGSESIGMGIRSLDYRADTDTILVGTKSSDIIEMIGPKFKKTRRITEGHYEGELWGLAVDPNGARFATFGGDKTLRVWDLKKLTSIISTQPMKYESRALDWSPDGKYLASGLMNGVILLMNAATVESLDHRDSSFKDKKCNMWISDIKFSPDNTKLAFGGHGTTSPIELFGIENKKLSKLCIIKIGLTSALTHLDWNKDGSMLVANSQAYELKWCDINTKKNVFAKSVRDEQWASWTCLFGFPVQGIYPPSADGTDVNSTSRSNSEKVLATGDDFGKVKLFKYPSVAENSEFKEYGGHSSFVCNVRFSYNDEHLISVGGNDKSIFIWETDFGEGQQDDDDDDAGQGDDDDDDDDSDMDLRDEPEIDERKEKKKDKIENALEFDDDTGGLFQEEEMGEGDQFMAVKPWLGAIREPTWWKKEAKSSAHHTAPNVELELDFVHGYRGNDCRNNLRYLKDGTIAYNAAGLGIVYDSSSHSQTFFNQHTDDVTAIAFHPNGVTVATGEQGKRPVIHIWNSSTMASIHKLKGQLQRGIAALAFSPSGKRLAGVGIDNDHSIAVYDSTSGTLLLTTKGDTAKIMDIAFRSDDEFSTVGVKHYKCWTINGASASTKKGIFKGKENKILCITSDGSSYYSGVLDGSVYQWDGPGIKNSTKCHTRAVDALETSKRYIISGAKDGKINLLDKKTLKVSQTLDMNTSGIETLSPGVRSIFLSSDESSLLIGTSGCEIIETDIQGSNWKVLIHGHYGPCRKDTNEVWGLARYPDGDKYASCSDDGTVRVWSLSSNKMLKMIDLGLDDKGKKLPPDSKTKELNLGARARCVDISNDGSKMALGFRDGTARVYDAKSYKLLKKITDAKIKEKISNIKFSPNGKHLAIASHDNFIHIFDASSYARSGTCKGHSSYITHIDWTKDSSGLHSTCGAYELLFWDDKGKQKTKGASELRDEEWASWTAVLGWPVQGIYPKGSDGTDVNGCDRSNTKFNNEYELLATADDFGMVKMFRYPCVKEGSDSVIGRGHSSHVTNCLFSEDDSHVFSTGGNDQCVFSWKVNKK